MKPKNLKAFTLAELIIVMAIFGMIMMGAIALVGPTRALFTRTQQYENVHASMDNVNNIIETTVRNANRMQMYIGWDSFDSISTPLDYSTPMPRSQWDKNIENTTGSTNACDAWGYPINPSTGTGTNMADHPIDYFRKRFFLVNMTLRRSFTVSASEDNMPTGVTWPLGSGTTSTTLSLEHTITIQGRGIGDSPGKDGLDSALSPNNLSIYVLCIYHEQGTDPSAPGYRDPSVEIADPSEIGDICLREYRNWGDTNNDAYKGYFTETSIINPVYLKNYDFKMIFGNIATDNNNNYLWDELPIPGSSPEDYNLVFKGNNIDSRVITADNPAGTFEGSFFYEANGMLGVTLMAKPKPTTKEPNPTYRDSNLIMTNAMKLDRMLKSNLDEPLYFNFTSSKMTVSPSSFNGIDYDPIRRNVFADVDLPGGAKFSYNDYPVREAGMTGNMIRGEEDTSSVDPDDPYLIITNRFYALKYYDKKFTDRNAEEKYNSVPYVKRFEEFYNNTLAQNNSWNHDLTIAQTNNIFMVFTLPKEFNIANIQ